MPCALTYRLSIGILSPLHKAVDRGNEKIVQLLLEVDDELRDSIYPCPFKIFERFTAVYHPRHPVMLGHSSS